jgi:LysR family glycine cleavage system transcriptional activator
LAGQEGVPIWQEWFRQAGIEGRDVARGLRFSSSDHALDAALEGAGMLLTHSILAHDELRSERLVMPFNVVIPSQRAYYFVYPKEKKSATNICAFRDWIRGEISADQN